MFSKAIGCVLAAALALMALTPAPARAAQGYDNCTGFIDTLPATIGREGTWCLRKDLSTSMISGSAITVAADDVTIDCNDFKLGGLGAGPDSLASGIRADFSNGVTVRNCGIRGFESGVHLFAGIDHLVTDNRLDGSLRVGIYVDSVEAVVRDNLIRNTGAIGADASSGIYAANGVDILDNVVRGVVGQVAYGIELNENDWNGVKVSGNLVSGVAGSVWTAGLREQYSSQVLFIVGNVFQGPGVGQPGVGISCHPAGDGSGNFPLRQATVRANVILGFSEPVVVCDSATNSINGN